MTSQSWRTRNGSPSETLFQSAPGFRLHAGILSAYDTTSAEQKDLMEIFEYRGRGKSTILCSQCAPEEWHTKLGSGYVADAILEGRSQFVEDVVAAVAADDDFVEEAAQ